jgi:hypothetical protein
MASTSDKTREIAEARRVLEASMNNIGSSLDNDLKSRATTLHANSAALDKQQKQLIKETANLKKQTDALVKVANEGMKGLKETGDVQNWAEVLEREFLVLEETMRLVEEGSSSESGWSSDGEERRQAPGKDDERDVDMGGMHQEKERIDDGQLQGHSGSTTTSQEPSISDASRTSS